MAPGRKLTVCVSPACRNRSRSGVGILRVPASVLPDFVWGRVSIGSVGEESDELAEVVVPGISVVIVSDSDQNWAVVTLVSALTARFALPPRGCIGWWLSGDGVERL